MTNAVSAMLLYLAVWFDGVSQECLIDTGSAHTILSQSAAAQLPTLVPDDRSIQLRGVGGAIIGSRFHLIPTVEVSDLNWPNASLVVLPDEALYGIGGCILGNDLLGQQSILFDFQRRMLRAAS